MQTNCPKCQKPLLIKSEFGGRPVKCPKCGDVFTAPLIPPVITHAEYSEGETPPVAIDTSRRNPAIKSKDIIQKSRAWVSAHKKRCGTRSFIFQTILLAWTAFMFLAGFGLMLSAASSTSDAMDSPFASRRSGAAGAFLFVGICCPLGVYSLLAIPVGIGAIATLKTDAVDSSDD